MALLLGSLLVAGSAYASLRHGLATELVAHWWISGAVATALVLHAPRRLLPLGLALSALGTALAAVLAGLDPVASAGLAVGTVLEVGVVVAAVTRRGRHPARLGGWNDLRRWITGIAVGTVTCAVVLGAAVSLATGTELWRIVLWTWITHAAAQLALLPLHVHRSRHRVRISHVEVLAHVALLTLAITTYLRAPEDQPVAHLLLPLLVWSGARFPSRWAMAELYVVCLVVALATATDRGPFRELGPDATAGGDMAATAQNFIGIACLTTVSLMVAMSHLHARLQRIRRDELRLGQLLDSAHGTAFVATDVDGLISWFSPGAEQLTGYRAEDLLGRCDPLILHDAREVLARARELGLPPGHDVLTGAVIQGEPQEMRDWTYLHRDGHRLTVSVSVSAVHDAEAGLQGHLFVVRDVTERRSASRALERALEQQREATRELERLDRAKNDFVSAVSHDLRTPLTSIMGYAEVLQHDLAEDLSTRQRDVVERIDRNSARLLHLVEDLLTLARVEDGIAPTEHVELDLRRAARGAVEAVGRAAHLGDVGVLLHEPDAEVTVRGDQHQLERMILNLVGNAVKFTPPGGRVDLRLARDAQSATIRVEDTGVGIPLEEQDQLFERFFRSSTATENAIEGTGLGLAIVRSIIEAHHGAVEVSSQPGVGTTFAVRLPVSPQTPAHPGSLPESDLDVRSVMPSTAGYS